MDFDTFSDSNITIFISQDSYKHQSVIFPTTNSSNIDDILKRGENLEDLGQRSRTLKNSSKVFAKQARWMRVCKEMQQYALVGAVLLVILFVLWWKLF